MSFNGQTTIFSFLQWAKEPKIPYINLINHNLNEPLATTPCIKLTIHFSKTVRIKKILEKCLSP